MKQTKSARTPETLIGRAILAIDGKGEMAENDFRRAVYEVCNTEPELRRVVNALQVAGLTERRVTLTDAGKAALEKLKILQSAKQLSDMQ